MFGPTHYLGGRTLVTFRDLSQSPLETRNSKILAYASHTQHVVPSTSTEVERVQILLEYLGKARAHM